MPSERRPHHPCDPAIRLASASESATQAWRDSMLAIASAAASGLPRRCRAAARPNQAWRMSSWRVTSANRVAARAGSVLRQALARISAVTGSWGSSRCARSSQRRADAGSRAASAALPRSTALRARAMTVWSAPSSRNGMDQLPAARTALFRASAVASVSCRGGKPARSILASCRPCATARSVQRRASSMFCSPARLRAR